MLFPELLETLNAFSRRDELREWVNIHGYVSDDLKSRALLSYIDDWLRLSYSNQDFNLENFLSADLSSIMYGSCPVIFLGTNDWATKRFKLQGELDAELDKWRHQLKKLMLKIKKPVYCCIIPEKDTVVREFSRFDNDSTLLTSSIDSLMLECKNQLAGYSYLEFVQDIPDKRISNYEYYDSHLLSRDYLKIFFNVMQGFNLIDDLDRERIVLRPDQHVGDLAKKFRTDSIIAPYLALTFLGEGANLVSGDSTFRSPLRRTKQSFKCSNASIKAKIVIYGDSHSSIYDQKKLTYLFANTFEECVFYWDPFCVNNKRSDADADFVVFEISQRFLI